MPRTVFLHCGLHKTGTTAIQRALCADRDALGASRLLYPTTGGEEAGHHNLAWELTGDSRFDSAGLTLSGAIAQIGGFDGDAVLSSEDFEVALGRPALLHPLFEAVRMAGRDTCLVIYLRDPRNYAKSLYLELLGHGYATPYQEAIGQIRAEGLLRWRHWVFHFDYRVVRASLAAVPGLRVAYRDYDQVVRRGSVVRDFLAVVGLPPDLLGSAADRRVNTRVSAAKALSLFCANRSGAPLDAASESVIDRLAAATPTRLDRLCSARSADAIAALARMPPEAAATEAAERELVDWWSGRSWIARRFGRAPRLRSSA